MPVRLRIIAIILAFAFFIYVIRLVRSDKAEVRHMLKWIVLAIIILLGSIFSGVATDISHFLGIRTLSFFALFVLVALLLLISLRYQMSLISAEKQIKTLTQELSLLKKRTKELEDEKDNRDI